MIPFQSASGQGYTKGPAWLPGLIIPLDAESLDFLQPKCCPTLNTLSGAYEVSYVHEDGWGLHSGTQEVLSLWTAQLSGLALEGQ